MKTNLNASKFALPLIAIFLSVFLISFASAAISIDSNVIKPTSVKHDAGTFTVAFNVTNTGTAGDFDLSLLITNGKATVSLPSRITLDSGVSAVVNAVVTFDSYQSGSIGGTFKAGTTATKTFVTSINFFVLQ